MARRRPRTAGKASRKAGRKPARSSPRAAKRRRASAARAPSRAAGRRRSRWWKSIRRLPFPLQAIVVVVIAALACVSLNWIYQAARKPTELFFPVSGALYKTPTETWRAYAPIFRAHSTRTISPEFLAALAQVEGSGNPVVRTYWRLSWSASPLQIYRPASSAVGMYQITDGTFAEARRYCIHDHRVVEDEPRGGGDSCWFNSLYLRVVPSHAVELTSAYLDTQVSRILARQHRTATARQKQDLAAVTHLCGAGAASRYAARGFQASPGQRCGDHDVAGYVAKVTRMARLFDRLSRQDEA